MARDIDHNERTGKLDVDHLAGLSDDAVPALAAALPRLDAVTRQAVVARFCRTESSASRDWLARSRSADLAGRARDRVCPG